MIRVVRELLSKIIGDIDAGNTNLTESEAIELVKIVGSYADRTQKMSKYKACQYLNVSRATFDNYVREGLLPRGTKEPGFKELFWQQKDLDNFIKSRSNDNKKKL